MSDYGMEICIIKRPTSIGPSTLRLESLWERVISCNAAWGCQLCLKKSYRWSNVVGHHDINADQQNVLCDSSVVLLMSCYCHASPDCHNYHTIHVNIIDHGNDEWTHFSLQYLDQHGIVSIAIFWDFYVKVYSRELVNLLHNMDRVSEGRYYVINRVFDFQLLS